MVLLGYNSNGFTSHRLEDAADWLAELGYRALALTPDVGHLDPANSSAAAVQAFGERCRALGLRVVVETGARYLLDPRRKHRPNLLDDDPAAARRVAFLEQMIAWARPLGADLVSFWSGALPTDLSAQAAEDRLVARLASLLDVAQEQGVRLALEPEPGHLIQTVADWQRLHSRLDARLGLTLDVGHLVANQEGPLLQVVAPVREAIWNVQLADMPAGVHEHRVPGEGAVDWAAVHSLCQQLPADTPACFELSRDSHRFHELAPSLLSDVPF